MQIRNIERINSSNNYNNRKSASYLEGKYSSIKESNNINLEESDKRASFTASGACADIMSVNYKLLNEKKYDDELADAKVNDIKKYNAMIAERKASTAKTLSQLQDAALNGGTKGTAEYNGVAITFDSEKRTMTVGDMSSGRIINCGMMSNGYSFSFNRDNINDIRGILDLFSPEDVNKILRAIAEDNFVIVKKQQMEDEAATVSQISSDNVKTTAQEINDII